MSCTDLGQALECRWFLLKLFAVSLSLLFLLNSESQNMNLNWECSKTATIDYFLLISQLIKLFFSTNLFVIFDYWINPLVNWNRNTDDLHSMLSPNTPNMRAAANERLLMLTLRWLVLIVITNALVYWQKVPYTDVQRSWKSMLFVIL